MLSNILGQYCDLVFSSIDKCYGPTFSLALRYIERHYQNKITLEETAAAVMLSPTYFSRLFKEKMGQSFCSYINQLRVELAQQLLLNSQVSLAEIAGLVGFEDQSYFSRIFKQKMSVTPRYFRKRAKQFPRNNQEIH